MSRDAELQQEAVRLLREIEGTLSSLALDVSEIAERQQLLMVHTLGGYEMPKTPAKRPPKRAKKSATQRRR